MKPKFSIAAWAMNPDEVISVCQEAERLGYDSFFYGEGKGIECFSTITYLSSITSQIRLGPGISFLTYRHPVVMAKTAAAIDVLSNGRFELRFGVGAVPGYGVAKPSVSQRTGMLDEGIDIIKKLWQQGRYSHSGKYYDIDDAICTPEPTQRNIPVTVAARQKKMLRITARHADVWEAFFPPDTYSSKLHQFETECDFVGRKSEDVDKAMMLRVFLGKDEQEAKDMMNRYVERRNISPHRLQKTRDRDAIGSPSQCLEKFQQYIDLGITRFTLLLGDAERLEPLQEFYEKVVSRLR